SYYKRNACHAFAQLLWLKTKVEAERRVCER
ncbi:ASCH domain protein, partial [Vibrio parahaemolyticus V-223/04]